MRIRWLRRPLCFCNYNNITAGIGNNEITYNSVKKTI